MSCIDLPPGDGDIRQAWGIHSMKVCARAFRESAKDQGRHQGGAWKMILTSDYNLGARGALQGLDGNIGYICLILPSCVMADIAN